MNRRCFIQMGCYMLVCLFLAISTASARVCFLPDSTDCGEGEGKGGIVGSGNVEVPCQYSSCPAYNSNYQECYDERTYNNGGVKVTCKQVRCKLSKSECEEQEDNPNSTQCCNLDSASGCYYMGKCPVLCNRNIYDSTTALPEEDYNCTSCKDKNGTFYNCTAKEKECKDIKPNYTSKCGDSQTAEEVEGVKDSNNNQCYTCKDKPVEKNCSDIKKIYKNINQVSQCENYEPVEGVSAADGQCYKCTIGNCFGKESKIYYVTYGTYLQGNVAYHSTCQCSSYLVKGNSPNTRPIKTTAISTPGGGSSSTEKIKLPTILTGVSSSNPYSVKIEEDGCFGDDHCSAQAVKFDVFEKYAPDTAKSLKEDDYFFDGVGVATTFKEGLYFYTGRQLKPKSQSINTCDDYVVILGNGNPKACAQKSSDYYNYQEACPKGLEKKIVPNVYDSTGAQCYTCEKEETCTCPSGYSFDKTSVSSCGITESSGWTFDSKTVCGKTCGKCTAKTCPRGYRTGNISCTSQSANKIPFGYTYSDIFAGDERCKKCKYRYHYTCEDYGKVNVGEGCGLKICSYPCGNTLCSYSTKSDKLYTTLNGSCYEYTKGKTEWYVDE